MALSSALFSGISGLSTLGNAMQIIGDNIANVNTVGFKGSTFTFQDLLSQSISTQSGTAQVGRGTALGDVAGVFEQGSFESTGNTTDLAIGGAGFFVLREDGTENNFYTRAGNFRFNKDGYLVNPEGYIVQGWRLDENGEDVGSVTDIVLDSFTSPPEQSSRINVITNLDADSTSQTDDLSGAWDASNDPPIDTSNYVYQTTVKVYDSLGSTHDITVYYDKGQNSNKWEYIITCNPSEDKRSGFAGTSSAGLLAKGEITFDNSGKITNLTLENQTAPGTWTAATTNSNGYYEFNADFLGGTSTTMNIEFNIGTRNEGSSPPEQSSRINVITNLDADSTSQTDDLSGAWDASNDPPIDTSNYVYQTTVRVYDSLGSTHDITVYYDKGQNSNDWEYIITCNPDEDMRDGFSGRSSAGLLAKGEITFDDSGKITNLTLENQTAPGTWTAATTNSNGYYEFNADFLGGTSTTMNIEFNIGTRNEGTQDSPEWVNDSLTTTQSTEDSTTIFQSANGGVTGSFVNDSLTTTQFAAASTTTFQSANGYGAGDLQGVDVDVDGVVTGVYSNGQLIPLFRVALAKFQNNQGLKKVGGNLYRATRQSGDAITNRPGTNGLGSIAPNSLEQSNVDIANEFVKMITTQRGFQANSKIITVTDQMLADLINLKR